MQDKRRQDRHTPDRHKVTLYLPPELHRQLKIRSAVETEAMSAIAERAITFYLTHSDVVDEVEASVGQAHRVYACPECASALVMAQGELVGLKQHVSVLDDDQLSSAALLKQAVGQDSSDLTQDEGELVPC